LASDTKYKTLVVEKTPKFLSTTDVKYQFILRRSKKGKAKEEVEMKIVLKKG